MMSEVDKVLSTLPPAVADQYRIARADTEHGNDLPMRTWLSLAPRLHPYSRAILELDVVEARLAEIENACTIRQSNSVITRAPVNQTNELKTNRLAVLKDAEGFLTGLRVRTVSFANLQTLVGQKLNRISELRGLILTAPVYGL